VTHPNHAGLNAGIVMLASLYLRRIHPGRWLVALFVAAVVVLLATKSRTALSATLVAGTVYLLLSSRTSRAAAALLVAAWVGAGFAVAVVGRRRRRRQPRAHAWPRRPQGRRRPQAHRPHRHLEVRLMQAGNDPNRSLIGYGYETFWTPDNVRGVSEFVKFKIPEGHNLYLDWYLELGAVGVGLFVLILLTALWRWTVAACRLHSPAAALAAAVLCGTVIHGFAESSLGDASLPTLLVYAALAGAAVLRPDEEVGV
jgi:O-antigen ligase